ncbi:MAG: hypothetical protein R3C61_16805 [Bacteroidia bacterium]
MMSRYLLLWLPLLAFSVECRSQSPLNELFASDSLLHLRLVAPMVEFLADRSDDAPDHPASVFYVQGDTVRLDCEILVKGHFRRQKQNCEFPPMRIKFEKKDIPGTLFENHRKLKLVSHCTEEAYVLREYLAYRMLHLLTPYSFRVRLVRVSYEDIFGRTEPLEKFAFLIEDEEIMAERMGGQLIENQELGPDSTQREQTLLVALFQYMIGNTDWDIKIEKNIKLLQVASSEWPVVVPFDFDWSGWVDAPYTAPFMENFERRRFARICRTEEEFAAAFDLFLKLRPQFEATINEFTWLDKRMRKDNLKYIQEFYNAIGDEKIVRQKFYNTCPGNKTEE